MRILVPTLIGLMCRLAAAQSTIAVPIDQPTIQAALDAALPGDVVLVGPGTWFEHDLDYQGKSVALRSSGGPAVTTIDAQGLGRGVLFVSGEGAGASLEGSRSGTARRLRASSRRRRWPSRAATAAASSVSGARRRSATA